jgi:hypothetical protein
VQDGGEVNCTGMDHIYPSTLAGSRCYCGLRIWGASKLVAAPEPEAPKAAPKAAPKRPVITNAAAGWKVLPKPTPRYRAGSLNEVVIEYVRANPGQSTKAIVMALQGKAEGNVAACISRMMQNGIIEKG